MEQSNYKALVRTQTTLRFVCAAQLGRYLGRFASEITVARVEHPLVIRCFAPDNKREERTTKSESKLSNLAATHPRHRYTQNTILSINIILAIIIFRY